MGYTDLPQEEKNRHDEIATVLGLDPETMTEMDVLLAIIRKMVVR